MSANNRQEGGSHYQTGGIQHWDLVVNHDVEYLPGCASKYLVRWRKKNGVADLRKAVHYIDKMIEVYSPDARPTVPYQEVQSLCAAYDLPSLEVAVIGILLNHKKVDDLISVKKQILRLIAAHGPGTPDDGGHHAKYQGA